MILSMSKIANDGALAYYRNAPRTTNPYNFRQGWLNSLKQRCWNRGYDEAKQQCSERLECNNDLR